MPARLQIQPKDCSPLGLLILSHLEKQHLSMNRLAEMADIPQPRLRGACFKGTCPTPETLRKLSRVIGLHHLELYTLAYEGRIVKQPEEGDLDSLIRELFGVARTMERPKEKPSLEQIEQALVVLGFMPKGDSRAIFR